MSVPDKHTLERRKIANKKYNQAKKITKKGLFNLRPDYNHGAQLFEEAAMLFKNLDMNKEALHCLLSAGEANLKSNNSTMAGKNFENAGKLLCDLKKYIEALKYFERASTTFYEDGKPERSTEILVKAAEYLQKDKKDDHDEKIIDLFKRAIEIMVDNEKFHYGMQYFQSFNSFLCKIYKFEDVLHNLSEQKKAYKHLKQTHNIWKANLCIVVICCKIGDLERADKYLDEFAKEEKKWSNQEEYIVADRLIDICDTRDEKGLQLLKKEDKIKYIENAVSRVARKLTFENIKNKRLRKTIIKDLNDDTDSEEEEGESDEDGDSNR